MIPARTTPAELEKAIRNVPDFPKPGIQFKDITPVLADARLFAASIDLLMGGFKPGTSELGFGGVEGGRDRNQAHRVRGLGCVCGSDFLGGRGFVVREDDHARAGLQGTLHLGIHLVPDQMLGVVDDHQRPAVLDQRADLVDQPGAFPEIDPAALTKSGIMVGLGETWDEVIQVMQDLRAHDVDILTVGQYLRPTRNHLPVLRYWHPDEFARLHDEGMAMGFRWVESGPLVRSSFHADGQARALVGRSRK